MRFAVVRLPRSVHAPDGRYGFAGILIEAAQRTKDGRGTAGIAVPKTNWANRLVAPPFEAYQVTCGITFTFGGLRVAPTNAQVMDTEGEAIHGLYAAGELVGGLFYFNYPGGTGLTSGAVFGRMAGAAAAGAVGMASR